VAQRGRVKVAWAGRGGGGIQNEREEGKRIWRGKGVLKNCEWVAQRGRVKVALVHSWGLLHKIMNG
jgi:hypothetical protein